MVQRFAFQLALAKKVFMLTWSVVFPAPRCLSYSIETAAMCQEEHLCYLLIEQNSLRLPLKSWGLVTWDVIFLSMNKSCQPKLRNQLYFISTLGSNFTFSIQHWVLYVRQKQRLQSALGRPSLVAGGISFLLFTEYIYKNNADTSICVIYKVLNILQHLLIYVGTLCWINYSFFDLKCLESTHNFLKRINWHHRSFVINPP